MPSGTVPSGSIWNTLSLSFLFSPLSPKSPFRSLPWQNYGEGASAATLPSSLSLSTSLSPTLRLSLPIFSLSPRPSPRQPRDFCAPATQQPHTSVCRAHKGLIRWSPAPLLLSRQWWEACGRVQKAIP